MKLSVIIPVYNEEKTVRQLVEKVAGIKVTGMTKETVIVNDGSTDGTAAELKKIKLTGVKIITHPKNMGKGAAIRTGMSQSDGDVLIIQDADLEYDPGEYPLILSPIVDGLADVVYGSRFISFRPHRVLYFWHMAGNRLLTFLTNIVTNMNFTDMETCYKAFTREVANSIELKENRFGFEPEFTIKAARKGFRVFEVGVSYWGRGYGEGKKINWKDGVWALWCILKYGVLTTPSTENANETTN